jgi:hypothetical protein
MRWEFVGEFERSRDVIGVKFVVPEMAVIGDRDQREI